MKMTGHIYEIPADMERVKKITEHSQFKKAMEMIRVLEEKRKFCRHDISHLLDVARIAYIENLESSAGFDKDVIYGAGLLHDVGKYLQYTEGIGHHISSERLARIILTDAGYESFEIEEICQAIRTHRCREKAQESILGSLIYRADKISRACYVCDTADECDWSEEKKTPGVIV